MKNLFGFIFIFEAAIVFSQFSDDFSDGDFSNNPNWQGTIQEFVIDENGFLKLNNLNPASSNISFLSTPSNAVENAAWEFTVGFEGLSSTGLSSSNRMLIYLMSDVSDLSDSPKGYYVMVGSTQDDISLYATGNSTPLIDGEDDLIKNSSAITRVRVTRDNQANWELLVDENGGQSFNSQGTALDETYLASQFFGVLCQYTSTRADKFFFDDFNVQGSAVKDVTPPQILDLEIIDQETLHLIFDEPLDKSTAQNIISYSINRSISILQAQLLEDRLTVMLTIDELNNGETYSITINSVEDLHGNPMSRTSFDFHYIVFEPAIVNDVLINEFLADPSPSKGLPEIEFIELYNRSEKFINLIDWQLHDKTGSSSPFPPLILAPGEYLLVSEDSSLFSVYGKTIEINLPTLNNSADDIFLKDHQNNTVHSTYYNSFQDGITTELINPNGPEYGPANYGFSIASIGGTPGRINSVYDDTPDILPPAITTVFASSNNTVIIEFNEAIDGTSAENQNNYLINKGIQVRQVRLDSINRMKVDLGTSTMESNSLFTLTINGVKDLSGNELDTLVVYEFLEIDMPAIGDLVINEFLSDPTPSKGLPESDFIEIMNISSKYIQLEGITISDNAKISSSATSFVLRPDSLVIVSDVGFEDDFSLFGTVLSLDDFPNFNASSGDEINVMSPTGDTIIHLTYPLTSNNSGVSYELINPFSPCISFDRYSTSTSNEGGTPGRINSVFDPASDVNAPSILYYSFDSLLVLQFSEVLDTNSISIESFVVNKLSINELDYNRKQPNVITISFNELIEQGTVYTMEINDLADCMGNVMIPTAIQFGIGRSPNFNDLIITEVMYDPSPSFQFPEREFIEIVNLTNDILSTSDLSISDALNTVNFPIMNLNPQEYYILSSSSAAREFAESPLLSSKHIIPISGFPSLSNLGEQLIISLHSKLITSLNYSPNWHSSKRAKEGGVSLELVDLSNPCLESSANWTSSENNLQATPGEPNSVSAIGSVPDNFGPYLINALAISPDTLRIDFNEKIDPSSIETASISFAPNKTIDTFFFELRSPQSVFIKMNDSFIKSEPVKLKIEWVLDCNGNENSSTNFVFALAEEAKLGQILLSEILFNPRVNGVDFVEIYNASNQYLSLKNWSLARLDQGIDDLQEISNEELVIAPQNYLAFTEDAEVLFNNYPKGDRSKFLELTRLPTYANDTGNVILLNHNDEIQEVFRYDDDYHNNLIEDTDGVSLERISFNQSVNNSNNWSSASSTENFATPGKANSQSFDPLISNIGTVEVDPKVFIPGVSGRNFTTINYQFEEPGNFANVTIYDKNGRLVRTLANGTLLSTKGFFLWNGDTDAGGNARIGYHIVIFEVYNSNGKRDVIKETVVVGRRFR